jgi:hypothetical protein
MLPCELSFHRRFSPVLGCPLTRAPDPSRQDALFRIYILPNGASFLSSAIPTHTTTRAGGQPTSFIALTASENSQESRMKRDCPSRPLRGECLVQVIF